MNPFLYLNGYWFEDTIFKQRGIIKKSLIYKLLNLYSQAINCNFKAM